jgi:hypothetical protein
VTANRFGRYRTDLGHRKGSLDARAKRGREGSLLENFAQIPALTCSQSNYLGLCSLIGGRGCLVLGLFRERSLAFAVEIEQVAQLLLETPDRINGRVGWQNRVVVRWDPENQFPDPGQLGHEEFRIDQPRVRKLFRRDDDHGLFSSSCHANRNLLRTGSLVVKLRFYMTYIV